MGQSLQDASVRTQLDELKADTMRANEELEAAITDATIDAIGVFDPTPVSDAIGAVRSAAQGDWIGAGLSLVSMLPGVGDAIGKTAKGARVARRINAIRRTIADNVAKAHQITMNALKRDAAGIRAQRAAAKGAKIEESLIEACPMSVNRFGTHTPKNGWSGARGNSAWNPKEAGLKNDKIKEIESVTGGKPVGFKDGYPDFSDYVHRELTVDGRSVSAEVEIELSRAGDREADFAAAREAMADKLGVKTYEEPKGFTWHHAGDGVSMELVPSALHNNVPHSGGVSLAKDPLY